MIGILCIGVAGANLGVASTEDLYTIRLGRRQ
jgi:hypothetical protein